MTLMTSIQAFSSALTDLQALCVAMKKYETAFSSEAKQLFQSMSNATDHALKELEDVPPTDASIAGYLTTGNKALSLRTVLQQVQQTVSGFSSGTAPVPRSSKEELSRVHGLILGVKFSLPSEQQLLITQLRKLCAEVEARKQDFDVIETNLDNTMRNVLQQVHGQAVLPPEVLDAELKHLQTCIVDARAAGAHQLEDILSLALNSIQRLHATHHSESEDEEDDGVSSAAAVGGDLEDDDDEDPFFMPMPGAIKWAEASKFKELAKPLSPEQPVDKQFMIVMEDDESSHTPSSLTAMSAEPSVNTLVGTAPAGQHLQHQEPLSEDPEGSPAAAGAAAASTAAGIAAAATTEAESESPASGPPLSESPVATPASVGTVGTTREATPTAVLADAVVATAHIGGLDEAVTTTHEHDEKGVQVLPEEPEPPTITTKTVAVGAAAGAPAVGVPSASGGIAAPGMVPAESPTPEKLTDFVNFLNGENPGACMFHAQMRLSPEGCLKLANFLRSSARVRALSLSHNYLGDAGLKLICDGLRENKSVTALDLPDNNITDAGAEILADAIKDNPSLTQLQLAYNKIGDNGAKALAQVIRTSHSLKKLGLAFNNIGKSGCQALTAAISSNQSLKHMQLLPGNPVEEKDAKALAKALKRNNKFSIKQLLGLKGDT